MRKEKDSRRVIVEMKQAVRPRIDDVQNKKYMKGEEATAQTVDILIMAPDLTLLNYDFCKRAFIRSDTASQRHC